MRKFETLARIPLFAGLSAPEIQGLDTQCVWRRVATGASVLEAGDDSADLYFVTHGKLRVKLQAISGKETILRDLGDGEYFGELAAIDGRPRSASIVALTDATVAKMPGRVFIDLLHRRPGVCDGVLSLLAGQIRKLANRVDEYSTLGVGARIHAELLRLARPDPSGAGKPIIFPPPTHAEIAARVACRREAVTRELNALARQGRIARRKGAIVLTDPEALSRSVEEARA